jgi:hypothetical protein
MLEMLVTLSSEHDSLKLSYLGEFFWRHNNHLTRFGAFDTIITAIGKIFQAGCNPSEM